MSPFIKLGSKESVFDGTSNKDLGSPFVAAQISREIRRMIYYYLKKGWVSS